MLVWEVGGVGRFEQAEQARAACLPRLGLARTMVRGAAPAAQRATAGGRAARLPGGLRPGGERDAVLPHQGRCRSALHCTHARTHARARTRASGQRTPLANSSCTLAAQWRARQPCSHAPCACARRGPPAARRAGTQQLLVCVAPAVLCVHRGGEHKRCNSLAGCAACLRASLRPTPRGGAAPCSCSCSSGITSLGQRRPRRLAQDHVRTPLVRLQVQADLEVRAPQPPVAAAAAAAAAAPPAEGAMETDAPAAEAPQPPGARCVQVGARTLVTVHSSKGCEC